MTRQKTLVSLHLQPTKDAPVPETYDYATLKADATLESCRVLISDASGRERLWARKLARNLVMLDNDPLSAQYRYADIVSVGKDDVVQELKQRIFAQRYAFRYAPAATEAEDLKLRRAIAARWAKLQAEAKAYGIFMWKGLGYLLVVDAVPQDEVIAIMTSKNSSILDMAVEGPDGEFSRVYWHFRLQRAHRVDVL